MNPLILSLTCLVVIIILANFLSLVQKSKILLYLSLLPCLYIVVYGLYLIFGPVDLYKDGSNNFFDKNPTEEELPIVFIILRFYEYLIVMTGLIFGYIFAKKLKND
tara:strand:+ start:355 stop:672 length:318 start_codon:yes stop_codon:yes gene_type:complete